MHSSQQLNYSPAKKQQKYKRFFNYQTNLKSNKDHQSDKLQQSSPNKILSFSTGLNVPAKINFHQLLSIPLEKQIQKQNSIKQNQTFFLKFQPQQNKKHQKISSKSKGQNIKKSTQKVIRFNERRNNLRSQRSERINKNNLVRQQQLSLKQASKTVYFKPLGKMVQNSTSQSLERKGVQFEKRYVSKNNEQIPGEYSYRDKLLMLLQIRRQQQVERKSKYVRSSFSQYSNDPTCRQFYSRSRMTYQKNSQHNYDQSLPKRQQSGKYINNNSNRYRSNYNSNSKRLKNKNDTNNNNNQPSPWQLVDNNIEEF